MGIKDSGGKAVRMLDLGWDVRSLLLSRCLNAQDKKASCHRFSTPSTRSTIGGENVRSLQFVVKGWVDMPLFQFKVNFFFPPLNPILANLFCFKAVPKLLDSWKLGNNSQLCGIWDIQCFSQSCCHSFGRSFFFFHVSIHLKSFYCSASSIGEKDQQWF